jgi:hypothetical protein
MKKPPKTSSDQMKMLPKMRATREWGCGTMMAPFQ